MSEKAKTNPFKKVESQEEVPSGLKDKVMTSITLAHLMGDFSELFTTKMGRTASKLIDVEKEKKKKNSN